MEPDSVFGTRKQILKFPLESFLNSLSLNDFLSWNFSTVVNILQPTFLFKYWKTSAGLNRNQKPCKHVSFAFQHDVGIKSFLFVPEHKKALSRKRSYATDSFLCSLCCIFTCLTSFLVFQAIVWAWNVQHFKQLAKWIRCYYSSFTFSKYKLNSVHSLHCLDWRSK